MISPNDSISTLPPTPSAENHFSLPVTVQDKDYISHPVLLPGKGCLSQTMAGFSDLSDTDDSAVEQILSEGNDAIVLDQIAAINCSGFTDSVLHSELESRFHRLKSFPVTKFNPRSSSALNSNTRLDDSPKGEVDGDGKKFDLSTSKQIPDEKISLEPKLLSRRVSFPSDYVDFAEEKANFPAVEVNPGGKKDGDSKSRNGSLASPSSSSVPSSESSMSPPVKLKSGKGKVSKLKSKSGFISSPLSCSNSVGDSPSPPRRRAGCFWCSPKKDSKKKYKENWAAELDFDLEKSDYLLSDSGSFSVKKQQKLLKKAMKEEEKISRGAQRTLELAKLASAKITIDDSDNDLSE